MKRFWIVAFVLTATCGFAQTTSDSSPPAVTMKQLMLDLIHPASNGILLVIFRGGPKDENEWAAVRHNALDTRGVRRVTKFGSGRRSGLDHARRDAGHAGTAAYRAAEAEKCAGAFRGGRTSRCVLHQLPQAIPPERISAARRFEMIYSRRHFLKAAGSGVALTVIGGETVLFGAVDSCCPGDADEQRESLVPHQWQALHRRI